MKDRSLIGTPESCLSFIQKLKYVGVDEVACLIDFVQDFDVVMASLPYLSQLQQLVQQSFSQTSAQATSTQTVVTA